MPTFLTTSGTAHVIEDIIIRAKTQLVLITPYIQLSRILFERLTEANQRGVKIQFVYGKGEPRAEERKQLASLNNLELLYLENLHAKYYHNDSSLLVSSMNLYAFSEKNNREMGILLTQREDAECFADALAEAQSIITAARAKPAPVSSAQPKVLTENVSNASPTSLTASRTSPQALEHNRQQRAIWMRIMHGLLAEAFPYTKFTLHVEGTISAKRFPRAGVDFHYDGASRFAFADAKVYDSTKRSKQSELNHLLGAYRCYWNRDMIQIYPAQDYEAQSEQAAAKYQVQAVQIAHEALQIRLF